MKLPALLVFLAMYACLPDATGSSGGGSSGGSSGGGSSSGNADAGVDPQRAATCNSWASATAACCAQSPGTCATPGVNELRQYCLGFARSCVGMPTCFSGGDCNTLIYCGGAC